MGYDAAEAGAGGEQEGGGSGAYGSAEAHAHRAASAAAPHATRAAIGGVLAGEGGPRRVSRVDPLAMAASVAMRLDRDEKPPRRPSVQPPAPRMSRAERAAMDAEVEGALDALQRVVPAAPAADEPPEEEMASPAESSDGSFAGARARGPVGGGGGGNNIVLPALSSARRPDGTAAPVSARRGPEGGSSDLPPLSGRD